MNTAGLGGVGDPYRLDVDVDCALLSRWDEHGLSLGDVSGPYRMAVDVDCALLSRSDEHGWSRWCGWSLQTGCRHGLCIVV